METIFENSIEIKANSNSFLDIPIIGNNASNLVYSDDINFMKNVFYSGTFNGEEIINEPIRTLIFKEKVEKLRIIIFNLNDWLIKGNIKINYSSEVFSKAPNRINGIDYSNKDLISLGQSVHQSEVENNYYINVMSPITVKYFKTEPDMSSADYMLNEYGVREMVGMECINIITKDNSLPQDEQAVYTEWGYTSSRFNVAIAQTYFEEKFGKGKQPRTGDFLIFMIGGMMMSVSSVQNIYGANRCLVGWNLSLVHHAINSSTVGTDDIEQYAHTAESWFNGKNKDNITDAMNSTYNVADYLHNDYNRSMLLSDVHIEESKLFNYYVIRNQYREGLSAITYRGEINTTKNFSVSFSIMSTEDDDIFMIGNNISIGVLGGRIYVKDEGQIFTSNTELKDNEWNTVLISFNRNQNTNRITLYNDSKVERQCEASSVLPNECVFKEDNAIMNVIASNSTIRRIRCWKDMIPVEYEARVILNEIVEKPSSAYVIDNCEPVLQTRKHNRPSNVDLWKDFLKNKTDIN